MITRSGSGSSSNEEMHAGSLRVVTEILWWIIRDGPVIQGSKRMRKGFGGGPAIEGNTKGSNVRRKEASSFRCLILSAILPILEEYGQELWRLDCEHSAK